MKKLLAVLLGALLVALAVPVYAATDLSFSGGYTLMHNIHDNYQRATDRDDINGANESWLRHRLNLKLTFQATDDIKVVWQIRAPHWSNWGNSGVGERFAAETRYFYAEITQPWGTIQVGRLADGAPGNVGGLATLGHAPSWGSGNYLYAGGSVFDGNNDVTDGINYNIQLDSGFGFAAYYFKMSNGQTINTTDDDIERFGIEPRYLWEGGGASLGFVWVRNMSPLYEWEFELDTDNPYSILNPYGYEQPLAITPGDDEYDGLADLIDSYNPAIPLTGQTIWITRIDPKDDYTFIINPAVAHSWGPFSIGFEGAFAWGKTKYLAELIAPRSNPANLYDYLAEWLNPITYPYAFEVDKKGFGLYFDATYNYGAGDISFLGWWADGTDWNADDADFEDAIGLGDFAPFLVAFGYNSIGAGSDSRSLNERALASRGSAFVDDDPIAGLIGGGSNQWGIGLLGNHSITDDIALNWGIGYFALVEPFYWSNATGWGGNPSKDLGWEIDLGAKFNLLDNLTYETQFGYFFNGDAFDRRGTGAAANTWVHAKDTFAWLNVLAVSF